jgi:arginyl-tRNA synthetase
LLKAPEKNINVSEIVDKRRSIEIKVETEVEWNLIKIIEDLPYTLIRSLKTLKPDSVANFTYSLASSFHKFYDACPVLVAKEKSILQTRILLVYLTIKSLESLFEVMGIDVLEKM